jgi:hypothetical protein
VLYLGSYLTADLLDSLIAEEFEIAGIVPELDGKPEAIELAVRQGSGYRLLFVLNTGDATETVGRLPAGDPLIGAEFVFGSSASLPAYEVLVIRIAA